eukprot:Gb_32025 [translate_table: standard]
MSRCREKVLLQSEKQDDPMGKRKNEESPSGSQFHCNMEIREHHGLELQAQLKAFVEDHPICITLENVGLQIYFVQPPLFFELESLTTTITQEVANEYCLSKDDASSSGLRIEGLEDLDLRWIRKHMAVKLFNSQCYTCMPTQLRTTVNEVKKGMSFDNDIPPSLEGIILKFGAWILKCDREQKEIFDLKLRIPESTNKMLDIVKLLDNERKKMDVELLVRATTLQSPLSELSLVNGWLLYLPYLQGHSWKRRFHRRSLGSEEKFDGENEFGEKAFFCAFRIERSNLHVDGRSPGFSRDVGRCSIGLGFLEELTSPFPSTLSKGWMELIWSKGHPWLVLWMQWQEKSNLPKMVQLESLYKWVPFVYKGSPSIKSDSIEMILYVLLSTSIDIHLFECDAENAVILLYAVCKFWANAPSDPCPALQMSVQENAKGPSGNTEMSKVLGDQGFVSSILASLPGVDPNDPSVKDLLASLQGENEVIPAFNVPVLPAFNAFIIAAFNASLMLSLLMPHAV